VIRTEGVVDVTSLLADVEINGVDVIWVEEVWRMAAVVRTWSEPDSDWLEEVWWCRISSDDGRRKESI
jgi:hypothetical protein